jgi:hypothetical protein
LTRPAEAHLWQAVGAFVFLFGALMLAYTFSQYGLASIEPRALRLGVEASFLMLAGGACFLAGRALFVEEERLTSGESFLWLILAAVSLVGGGIVVAMASYGSDLLFLDRLAIGLAGSFALMAGVLCLLTQRIMRHMRGRD